MRLRSALVFGLSLSLGVGGCATAGGAGNGADAPLESLRGTVYEPGIEPQDTRISNEAQLLLVQGLHEEALEAAQQGIAEDSTNARYYQIAGAAYVGLGDYEAAAEMWSRAEELYPAMELELEPDREAAWAAAFQEGLEAFRTDDVEGAIEAWEQANRIYDRHPEAFQNLGIIYAQRGDLERAIENYERALAALDMLPETRELAEEEVAAQAEMRPALRATLAQLLTRAGRLEEAEALYREALEDSPEDLQIRGALAAVLSQQGRTQEAEEIYTDLLDSPDLSAGDLWSIGISLFEAEDYERAQLAFDRYLEKRPYSRDGWYNLSIALYQQDDWEPLREAAERVRELDPLNENIAFVLRDAYRGLERQTLALELLQEVDQLPVFTDQIQLRNEEGAAIVSGQVIGHRAPAGTPIELEFTLYSEGQRLRSERVTVQAPAEGESVPFEIRMETSQPATGFGYELVN